MFKKTYLDNIEDMLQAGKKIIKLENE